MTNRTRNRTVTTTLTVVMMLLTIGTTLAQGTGVNVSVPTAYYKVGDTVNATILCTPTTWVKAWEMKILFSKNKLQATTVTEGSFLNFFAGTQTFFNAGTINNTAGTIKDIYDLILGIGNTTMIKPMVIIRFTAKNHGYAFINLSNVGLTNETRYLTNVIVTNTTFFIYSQYDLNLDKVVGLPDIILVAGRYGQFGAPGWIKEDINQNGRIDIIDIVLIAWHWGAY